MQLVGRLLHLLVDRGPDLERVRLELRLVGHDARHGAQHLGRRHAAGQLLVLPVEALQPLVDGFDGTLRGVALALGDVEPVARASLQGQQVGTLRTTIGAVVAAERRTRDPLVKPLEDGCGEARPQVLVDVMPGVEPELDDVPAEGRVRAILAQLLPAISRSAPRGGS
jgi:hypothetical protein